MSKKIVIVTDKVHYSKDLLPAALKFFPNCEIYFVHIFSIGLYEFAYPKNLKMKDFPIVAQPKWKSRDLGDAPHTVCKATGSELVPTGLCVQATLASADEIVCAVLPERTGVHAFKTLILHCCGEEAYNSKIRVASTYSRSEKGLYDAFENGGTTHDEWFVKEHERAEVKRYFEYNFNLNSAVIFGQALDRVGVDRSKFILSKNSLVVLYYLRKIDQIGDIDYLRLMRGNWVGTGKHQNGWVGSIPTQSTIIFQLIDVGLVSSEDRYYKISEKGRTLLTLLHPDCCDLDLPFRLETWCQTGLSVLPSIDRYIKTVFGKQKRFLNKI